MQLHSVHGRIIVIILQKYSKILGFLQLSSGIVFVSSRYHKCDNIL